MSRRLIIGEENPDIAGVLHTAFEQRGYTVHVAEDGPTLLDTARLTIPNVMLISATLPDADLNDLVRRLRAAPRTSHVPIICLASRDRYADTLSVLESGADDCIAKPFDTEELALRVDNAVGRTERENVVNPHSGLPGARLLEDHVQTLSESNEDGWVYVDLKIEHFEPFREVEGFVAADQVLSQIPGLLRDAIAAHGTDRDYVSHPADDHFVLVTFAEDPAALTDALVARFDEDAQAHYSFMDREMGYLTVQRGDEEVHVPLMTLTATEFPPDQLFGQTHS